MITQFALGHLDGYKLSARFSFVKYKRKKRLEAFYHKSYFLTAVAPSFFKASYF